MKSRPPGPKSWVGSARTILAEQVASPGSLGLFISDPELHLPGLQALIASYPGGSPCPGPQVMWTKALAPFHRERASDFLPWVPFSCGVVV